ncbi:MAG: MMPL family transporter [Treponemataceae bacterium]
MKAFFKWSARRPALVAAAAVLITAISGYVVATRMRMETNLDEYMPKTHPAFVYSDEAEARFMIRDAVLIAVEHPESVFNPATLAKLIRIEEDLIAFDEIEEADIRSLHTAENILGTAEGLDVRDFYTEAPRDQAEADAIRGAVRTNEMIRGRLVSADEKTALILVNLAEGAFSRNLYDRVLGLAEKNKGPETIRVAGRPIVEGTMAVLGPRDMARMGPLVILVIALVLFLVLRSALRAAIALAVVVFSTIWTFALMVGLGVPVYTVSIMIPVMLIAIGVAYGIHLYNQIDFYAGEHPEAGREEVAANVVDVIWNPVLFAGLTTMAGFVSLVTSQVYPIKYFGLFSAFGVLAALLLSMLLIPAGIVVFGLGRRKAAASASAAAKKPVREVSFGSRFADAVFSRPKTIIGVSLLVVILSLFGVSRVWINSSFLANFEKSSDIVKTDAFMNAHFGGTSTLNAIFEAEKADAFKDPALLTLLIEVQKGVLGKAKVGDSVSIADYLKRMNKVMHEDRAEFDKVPESAEMTAQYLLLYEMSGDPDNLWKVVDNEYKSANLTVQLKGDDSRTIGGVVEYIDSYAKRFAEYGVKIRYAGSGYKGMIFSGLILNGQLSSLGLSVLIVFLLVSFMFRSFLLGLIGTIPVAISIAVNFGVMGLLNVPLTTSTALISGIAVGIGVDYAIHFIERYRERLKEGYAADEAGRFAMSLTGRAVFLNAAIVIAGFLVLLFSVFPPNRQVGALVSLNMVTAFAGTVTIMFLVLRKSYVTVKEKRK